MGKGGGGGGFPNTRGGKHEYKKKISVKKTGGKPKDDIPGWARGERPYKNESGGQFAKRVLDQKYGPSNYKTGPGSEYSELRKYGDVYFK